MRSDSESSSSSSSDDDSDSYENRNLSWEKKMRKDERKTRRRSQR